MAEEQKPSAIKESSESTLSKLIAKTHRLEEKIKMDMKLDVEKYGVEQPSVGAPRVEKVVKPMNFQPVPIHKGLEDILKLQKNIIDAIKGEEGKDNANPFFPKKNP